MSNLQEDSMVSFYGNFSDKLRLLYWALIKHDLHRKPRQDHNVTDKKNVLNFWWSLCFRTVSKYDKAVIGPKHQTIQYKNIYTLYLLFLVI